MNRWREVACGGPVSLWALALLGLCALPAPALANPRIMMIGDSIVAGTKLRRVDQAVGVRLQRDADVIVHNLSSPGARMTDNFPFAGMRQAVSSVFLVEGLFGLRGLIVMIGTNDWSANVDLGEFHDAYAGFLSGLASYLPVLCVGPTWRENETGPNANGDSLDQFRDVIQSVCTVAGRTYLDGRDAIPNTLAYFPDGLHPNERGHRALAKFLRAAMESQGWLN